MEAHAQDVMWVSELLRADGRTLRKRFQTGLALGVRNCEDHALRLCSIAFGCGRTSPHPTKSRVGKLLRAAWDLIHVGQFVWVRGCPARVVRKWRSKVAILTSTLIESVTIERTDGSKRFRGKNVVKRRKPRMDHNDRDT